ncbi:hypothetical protein HPB48_000831 [Haemaphysalis longicornis]|uniref:Uncharacterized protein n=1 Tax=Haemaphysalis longicornis TaxID=44386 RepID=A0A9J6FKS0_HAELO|nr:hypothetical protein HPB48_000831 [Haemaphysalis longicornis]
MFCCPELLEPLRHLVNLTVNPCSEIFHYVCHGWNEKGANTLDVDAAKLTSPFAIMKSTTPNGAGRSLSAIFRSCIRLPTRPLEQEVLQALIDIAPLAPPYGFKEILNLIVALSLKYNVFLPVTIKDLENGYGLLIKPGIPAVMNFPGGNIALEPLFGRFKVVSGLPVTMNEVLATAYNLPKASSSRTTTNGNLSLLETLLRGDSPITFRSILTTVFPFPEETTVVVKSFQAVMDTLSLLTAPNNQPTAMAFVFFDAAAVTYKLMYGLSVTSKMHLVDRCAQSIAHFRLLTFKAITEAVVSKSKDERVLATVSDVKETIISRLSSLGEERDRLLVSKLLGELKTVLPSYAVKTITRTPNISENFVTNQLINEEVQLLYGLSHDTLHRTLLKIMVIAPYFPLVEVEGNYLVITPAVYSFVATTRSEAHFDVLASMGALVADALWQLVLKTDAWSARVNAMLTKLKSCSAKGGGMGLAFPTLSLETVALAARKSDWEKPVLVLDLLKSSLSQVFFMRFVYFTACRRSIFHGTEEAHAKEVVAFVNGTPGFREAFHCRDVVPQENNTCIDGVKALG